MPFDADRPTALYIPALQRMPSVPTDKSELEAKQHGEKAGRDMGTRAASDGAVAEEQP